MIRINKYFLDDIFNPLIGSADIDEEYNLYCNVNLDNIDESKKIIEEVLKPYFDNRGKYYKKTLKNTLSYYLSKPRLIDFENLFYSNLLPFNPPKNCISFFILIWEIYFDNENYLIDDFSNYKEINDLYEPLKD